MTGLDKCYKCYATSEEESLMHLFILRKATGPLMCVNKARCQRREWRRVRPRAMSKQLRARIDEAAQQKRVSGFEVSGEGSS